MVLGEKGFMKLAKKMRFSVQDDIRILENALTGKFQWPVLAKELNRTIDTTYERWKLNLKANITKYSAEKKITFEIAAQRLLIDLKELGKQGIERSPCETQNISWTPEMDRKLIRLVSKIGPSFSLFHSDFPGCSSQDMRQRYMQHFATQFNPQEEEKLLQFANSNFSQWDLHLQHFPRHAPYAITKRLSFLKRYGTLHPHIEKISSQVAIHGRDYLLRNVRENEYPGRGRFVLLHEWAFYEPLDQIRAIWKRHVDIELVRSTLQTYNSPFLIHLRRQEKYNRFYRLSTATDAELLERYRLGSKQ
jgi:hypothetical protein